MTSIRTASLAAALLAVPVAGVMQGCTDLAEQPTSAISPSNYYNNLDEVLGGLAGVYAGLRSTTDNYYNISQISTDENVVPTRGQDWYDNGKWLELHRQLWTPNSAAGLDLINNTYNDLFTGVARANVVLNSLKPNQVAGQAAIEAELRTLRAWYYFLLMDSFGGVPIVTTTEVKERPQNTRAEVAKFIETELLAARSALPVKWDAANYGRLTQGAADAILASLYLNSEVFTGSVTTGGLTKGTARWQDVITVSDRILNSGTYSLAPNWSSNFAYNNQSSPENIFVVRFSNVSDLGMTFLMRALHYSQLAGSESPWNGFATLADTYNSFDPADPRRKIFLVGPQVNLDTGLPVNDRQGNPLVFTLDIKDITQAAEGEGARIAKFTSDPNHTNRNMANDYPVFRLAEIYLMKAEAQNELGQTSAAVTTLNVVRNRVFTPPKPLVAANYTQATFRQALLKERLYELTAEAKRRQDMIRMGVYTSPFQYKDQREPFKILFPIPSTQLQTNPQLKQNPGY